MKHFCSFTSILIFTGLHMIAENEALLESLLQRGGKSIFWTWSNQFSRTDSQRRRRFSSDEISTDTWWKKMQENRDHAADGASNQAALSAGEETYFSGTGQDYPPPFDNPDENLPPPPTEETETKDMTETEKDMSEIERESNGTLDLPHHNLDTTLLRELIIEEHHRPSKTEQESVSQRLRDANENALEKSKQMYVTDESNRTKEDVEGSTTADNVFSDPRQSFVEYIIPGVEHVISHVEYVNDLDAFQELEEFRFKPKVEYVVPEVEFLEPEIGYLAPDRNISDMSTTFSMEDVSQGDRELEDEDFPVEEEYITIDQKRFLQVNDEKFTSSSRTSTKNHHTRRTGSSTRKSRRIHRRNPELGIPEVDYPTLEILPVVHFPCEEYTAPGYYADIASRCQMFHVCHEDGQRTSFLCPVGTVFNQEYLVCDWWYNVDCDNSMRYEKPESEAVGPDEKTLAAATFDLKHKIDAVRLGESTHSRGYNRIPAFPHLRNKEMSTLQDKTNPREEKANRRLENLSQKAMNYPMGYAILLRELMKNHETQGSDTATTKEHTNSKEIGGVETMDSSAQDGKETNLENRKEKDSWSAKQRNEFQREQKRHEYFGGSKPLTVTSGQKVYKNVRIKRIKVKYMTPNTRDVTFIQNGTKEPFAKTIRYEHWPERKLPRPEVLISRQRKPQNEQKERFFDSSNENNPATKQQNRWIFAEKLRNPIQRNDHNSRNITDEFEVIYPFRQNYHRDSERHRISIKNHNYNYNSAESNVENTEKQFVANDNSKSRETSTVEGEDEAGRGSFSFIPGKKIVLLTEKSFMEERAHATTKKPSKIPAYVKSATKKAYILEPEPFLMTSRNRKYGDRLSSRQFPFAVQPEKPTVSTELPIPEGINSTKKTGNATRERQSYTEESIASPVYLNNERFRISDKGLKSILGMKINNRTVAQPSPVYLGTKHPDRSSKTFKSLSNETSNVPCGNKTGSPEAAEFDYTSSFIKRISNLVSEIKSPGDTIRWNHTQSDNRLRKGKAYTISVRVEAKELVNGTSDHSRPKSVHSASGSARQSKPWSIGFLDGPVSPRTFNASHNRKKPFFMDAIKEHDLNKNNSRISNAHGGFVVKKVRLKRETSTQPSFENRPALSNEKLRQYFRERFVNFLKKILKVFR